MRSKTLRTLSWALVVAAVLAFFLIAVKAQEEDDGEVVIYYPGICHYLEPWSYWWFFFDCYNEDNLDLMAGDTETVTYSVDEHGNLRTVIERTKADGSVYRLERVQKFRRGGQ